MNIAILSLFHMMEGKDMWRSNFVIGVAFMNVSLLL
jgi:hypothetical protein